LRDAIVRRVNLKMLKRVLKEKRRTRRELVTRQC
jgi:hypothetical protein